MIFNEDKRIKFPVPFLKDKTVLYVDSRIGASHYYIEDFLDDILFRLDEVGYTFAFLPDLVSQLSPALLEYMFPGQKDIIFAEDMSQRIQDLAGLNDKTGFLYRQGKDIYFRTIPEEPREEIEAAIDEFIDFLSDIQEPETSSIRFSKTMPDDEDTLFSRSEMPSPIRFRKEKHLEDAASEIRFSIRSDEEPLDPKAQAIIDAWEKIEREFGVTLQDVEILLGYRVKLSRLNITTAGAIILPDFGGKEVKMDDLTKAIYFYYLKHPEGTRQKELQSHEEEILKYYMSITGRDDVRIIRKSLHNHLDPFGNSLNVSISRIKKAFKDIVGDRIAKFYYVDGRYNEPRKVALDRDYVIWDH